MTEFLLIASIHLVAVISPGPDFAVVLRQSLSSTRRSSVYTALGIATSEFFHCLYSIFGMELIMRYQENIFLVLKPELTEKCLVVTGNLPFISIPPKIA